MTNLNSKFTSPDAVRNRDLEAYFQKFRKHIIGFDTEFVSPYGKKKIIYADWTASGRLYRPIEEKLQDDIGPFVANTHTETSTTGATMTLAYHEARHIIKNHVNANADDVLITTGFGMTDAINKFQRILGLRVSENLKAHTNIPYGKRPIVFVSHMEHHSNHTSWLETIARVKVIPHTPDGLINYDGLEMQLQLYKPHPIKIVSITACSNVTGIKTDYHRMAKLIHKYNGLCFVDFACSAPYVHINMHPIDSNAHLDAIFFSPHKFLGGPGACGVLMFNKKLYKNLVPDNPGGGTVTYTNPWGDHDYIDDIETREDGGTPGFLQAIRAALAIRLKEQMGVENILAREHEINGQVFKQLKSIKNLHILAEAHTQRLGIFSFYIEGAHYNLVVKLLNDRFGIQTRGGCSCAGTYGHYLLNVDRPTSKSIEEKILNGCLSKRPGWVRMSIHPTTTNAEVDLICEAVKEVSLNFKQWGEDYRYDPVKNEFTHGTHNTIEKKITENWFHLDGVKTIW
jgi:selenocysteine lyase/cysteine desulfurase